MSRRVLEDDGDVCSAPTLLLLTGPPGTGKSSLAEHAADRLNAAVLGWDWVMAAMTKFDSIQAALRRMSHLDHRAVGWSILRNLATAQLSAGRSVVLDGVAREVETAEARDLAMSEGARVLVVATHCSDLQLHRSRVEGRSRGIPGWHELEWDHVSALLARWEPPTNVDLLLDAVDELEMNAATLSSLLGEN